MKFDVIVVGGSISGSTIALQLGRAGYSVALMDKSLFPREKACGEGLSAGGVSLLRELDIWNDLASIPKVNIQGYQISTDAGELRIPHSTVHGVGISRARLDAALIKLAENQSGVSMFLGENARVLRLLPNSVEIESEDRKLSASYVVLADGANSFLANSLAIPFTQLSDDRYGLRVRLSSTSPHQLSDVSVNVRDGFETYLTPIADDELNLSILGSRDRIKSLSRADSLSDLVKEFEDRFSIRLQVASEIAGAGPLGRVRRASSISQVLCIGDCAETFDPLGGMGMTHALLSSKLAAQTLGQAFCAKSQFSRLFDAYSMERWHQAAGLRGFTRVTSLLFRAGRYRSLMTLGKSIGLPSLLVKAVNHPVTKASPILHSGLFMVGGL